MEASEIIGRMNVFLDEAAVSLADWLNHMLPKTAATWWKTGIS